MRELDVHSASSCIYICIMTWTRPVEEDESTAARLRDHFDSHWRGGSQRIAMKKSCIALRWMIALAQVSICYIVDVHPNSNDFLCPSEESPTDTSCENTPAHQQGYHRLDRHVDTLF
jgi:hypothetical protein